MYDRAISSVRNQEVMDAKSQNSSLRNVYLCRTVLSSPKTVNFVLISTVVEQQWYSALEGCYDGAILNVQKLRKC